MKIPRPEHPRPGFERRDWLSLNGEWEAELDPGDSGEERGLVSRDRFDRGIVVPFCVESELSGVGHRDFCRAVWYRRRVRVPEEWGGGRVLLHFDAVDYRATVWVNGSRIGSHRGGSSPFFFDVTDGSLSGELEIVVRARDDARSSLQPRGKQSERYDSHGCHYTRVTGIWQTVWLEAVPEARIESLKLFPDAESGRAVLLVRSAGTSAPMRVSARALVEGKEIARDSTPASSHASVLVLSIPGARLWSPGDPFLYDLDLVLEEDGRVIDRVKSYFGLRSVRTEGMKVLLNGRPVFQRLVLNQGYYPDGIWTAPSDGALRKDVELSARAGFNGARLHQKVFEPRFLHWCDRLGHMVWGEAADWGLDKHDPRACAVFSQEWLEIVARDFNHPSLVGWCPFNETGGRPGDAHEELLKTVFRATRAADPTRLILDTSGYTHRVAGSDVYDSHDYHQDPAVLAEHHGGEEVWVNAGKEQVAHAGQPYMVSEYGGIWWDPREKGGWGYGERPKDLEEFYERYRGLTAVLLGNERICGFCYTQLTDVEQERNGIYYYDRSEKFDVSPIRQANEARAATED